jgi:hypothetical protein
MQCAHHLNGTSPAAEHCLPCARLMYLTRHEQRYPIRDYLGRIITPTLIECFDELHTTVQRSTKTRETSKGTTGSRSRRIVKVC